MVLDIWFFALAIPAVIFAGISKGGFGSGAAFAATPILALVIAPGMSLGIMLPLLMLVDVSTLGPYWGRWNGRDAVLLMLGAVPGVVIGVWLYARADPDVLRFLIGAVAILFVVYQAARARGYLAGGTLPAQGRATTSWGVIAGTVAGFTSFISHAGGPPASMYLLSRNLDKTTYQATTVLVFWVINILKFVPYAVLGIFTVETFKIDLMLAPFALLGAFLGIKAHHLVPERVFFGLTYVMLLGTGTKLIFDALI